MLDVSSGQWIAEVLTVVHTQLFHCLGRERLEIRRENQSTQPSEDRRTCVLHLEFEICALCVQRKEGLMDHKHLSLRPLKVKRSERYS